jgi:predicted transcriptional regulator
MGSELLRKEIQKRGGVSAVAAALQVSTAAVYYWLAGKREPPANLLDYLGLERRVRLVRRQAETK